MLFQLSKLIQLRIVAKKTRCNTLMIPKLVKMGFAEQVDINNLIIKLFYTAFYSK